MVRTTFQRSRKGGIRLPCEHTGLLLMAKDAPECDVVARRRLSQCRRAQSAGKNGAGYSVVRTAEYECRPDEEQLCAGGLLGIDEKAIHVIALLGLGLLSSHTHSLLWNATCSSPSVYGLSLYSTTFTVQFFTSFCSPSSCPHRGISFHQSPYCDHYRVTVSLYSQAVVLCTGKSCVSVTSTNMRARACILHHSFTIHSTWQHVNVCYILCHNPSVTSDPFQGKGLDTCLNEFSLYLSCIYYRILIHLTRPAFVIFKFSYLLVLCFVL